MVNLISYSEYVPFISDIGKDNIFGGNRLTPEELIVAIARISSNKTLLERTENPSKLIRYCIKNKHWSIFEMFNLCIYIKCPLFVATQILRHRSFCFQQLSQRYKVLIFGEEYIMEDNFEIRKAGSSNRQSSCDPFEKTSEEYMMAVNSIRNSIETYNKLIDKGVAPESARQVLPQAIETELFVNGTLRSWIHYTEVRMDEHTQKEHRDIAQGVYKILIDLFPSTFDALIEFNSK